MLLVVTMATGCSPAVGDRPAVPTSLIALLGIRESPGRVAVTGFCSWDSIDGSSALYVREEDARLRLTRNAFRLVLDTAQLSVGAELLTTRGDAAGVASHTCPPGYYTVAGRADALGSGEIWSGVLVADSLSGYP